MPGCPALSDPVNKIKSNTAIERGWVFFFSGICIFITVLWPQSAQEKHSRLHLFLKGLAEF